MPWNLSNERPIYLQLVDRIKRQIISGEYAPGDRFPSVRELALAAAVNPNTMQRALSGLEGEGLLVGSRTSGRSVTTDNELISRQREQIAADEYDRFYRSMKELGFNDEELISFVSERARKKGEDE